MSLMSTLSLSLCKSFGSDASADSIALRSTNGS